MKLHVPGVSPQERRPGSLSGDITSLAPSALFISNSSLRGNDLYLFQGRPLLPVTRAPPLVSSQCPQKILHKRAGNELGPPGAGKGQGPLEWGGLQGSARAPCALWPLLQAASPSTGLGAELPLCPLAALSRIIVSTFIAMETARAEECFQKPGVGMDTGCTAGGPVQCSTRSLQGPARDAAGCALCPLALSLLPSRGAVLHVPFHWGPSPGQSLGCRLIPSELPSGGPLVLRVLQGVAVFAEGTLQCGRI